MTRILVTGATGTVGKAVAEALIAQGQSVQGHSVQGHSVQGHSVRVGVRSPGKAAALEAAGAEVVRLDFEDTATIAPALDGVERVFLLVPFVEEFDQLVPRVLAEAKNAGVRHIVRLSAVGADASSPLALGRKHAAADAALAESGIGYTILQPTFFQDNILKYQLDALRGQGAFYGASHGGKVAYVSSRDIGDVAAAVLREPHGHEGQSYLLTGPEAIEDTRVAELASQAFGKTIAYVDVPDEAYAASMRDGGAPEWRVEAMLGLERVKSQGWAQELSPAVEQVLGRPAERMDAFLARHGQALA